ncbi:MAG: ABC transporter substrate-binding protein, partial [Deltaproteobacteria bacterium]|nr:ABC transporter substrate-binding protein [Nannocystaceae bacterium]
AAPEPTEPLAIALRRLPASLDPFTELDPWGQRIVDDLVFEGLTRRAGLTAPFVEPAIADDCRTGADAAPKHAWCHLRAGLRFHDGSSVDPEDVQDSLAAWLDPRRDALRMRHGLAELRKVELVDGPPAAIGATADPGRWVHIELERGDPLLLERIAAMKVIPKGKRRGNGAAFGKGPIGTGPMKVRQFDAEQLVLERASESARPAALEQLRFEAVSDAAMALVRLRRGELHVLADLPAAFVPRELAKPGMAARFTAWTLTPARYDLVMYNLRSGPQAQRKIRGALDLALPRIALATTRDTMPPTLVRAPVDVTEPVEIDLAALHEAKAAADWGAFGLPARPVDTLDAAGITEATAALEALGWRIDRGLRRHGNTTLRIVLMWDGMGGLSSSTAEALKRSWQKLGLQVPQVTASFAYLFGLMRRGEFDVALARLSLPSEADLYPFFHSKGGLNVPGLADADLDRELESYRAAPDRSARRSALERIAARLAELQPVSVLYAPTEIMLVSRRVLQLELYDDLPRLDSLALAPAESWPPSSH